MITDVCDYFADLSVGGEAPAVLRENNCIQLLTVLETHDGEAWPVRLVAEEAKIPETTARRLVFPEVYEQRSMAWVVSLRAQVNLSVRTSARDFTTNLVESFYGHMLADCTYLGFVDGVE